MTYEKLNNMGSICFSATERCYAIIWSYGEICVGCNCCGRNGKGLQMYEARLGYHKSELDRQVNFYNWIVGWEEIQKENQKANIAYHRNRIKYCKRVIKRLKDESSKND